MRFANTRARKNGNAAHTCTGARLQGTGRPTLPPMAESMREPLKIGPRLSASTISREPCPYYSESSISTHPGPPQTLRIPRENGPGGRGLGMWGPSAPSLSCLAFRCVSETQDPPPVSTYKLATPARGGGGLPLPAAAAAAPLKSCDNQGNADRRGRILDLKERKERFACTRGRAHRGKAPRAAHPFVFSRGRANPSKSNDSRAPAKEESAQ